MTTPPRPTTTTRTTIKTGPQVVNFGRVVPDAVTKRYTASLSLPLLDRSARSTSSLGSFASSESGVSASSQRKRRPFSSGLSGLSRLLLGSVLFALASVVLCGALLTKGQTLGDFTAPLVTVSSAEDETFADSIVSPLSYTEVRATWNRSDELKKRLEGKSSHSVYSYCSARLTPIVRSRKAPVRLQWAVRASLRRRNEGARPAADRGLGHCSDEARVRLRHGLHMRWDGRLQPRG